MWHQDANVSQAVVQDLQTWPEVCVSVSETSLFQICFLLAFSRTFLVCSWQGTISGRALSTEDVSFGSEFCSLTCSSTRQIRWGRVSWYNFMRHLQRDNKHPCPYADLKDYLAVHLLGVFYCENGLWAQLHLGRTLSCCDFQPQ